MNKKSIAKELVSFIDRSPSPYHVIRNFSEMLTGFTQLREEDDWKLKAGGKYYCIRKDSAVIIFTVPKKPEDIRIISAHSDSPSFKVKPHADELSSDSYTRLNVEKYGSMLMAQWLDRPLSIAGRVITKDGADFKSVLVDSKDEICIMPSVAIHMNREVNNGYKYDPKSDTIPLWGNKDAKGSLLSTLLKDKDIQPSDVLGYDLFLYNNEKGRIWGPKKEFISSRALDDLECAYTAVLSINEAKVSDTRMCMCCIFDNEEVGSSTGQGADSDFLSDVLSRIRESMKYSKSDISKALSRGYMISADNGHALHPNHPEYADSVNRPVLNGGIVIKYHSGQKYTTDAYSEAMMRDVCKKAKVPVQEYSNRNDIPGGSTLGNILNSHVSIRTVDIGLAQLAMHSPYETAGSEDIVYLYQAFKEFIS